jgi:hypothetical protein
MLVLSIRQQGMGDGNDERASTAEETALSDFVFAAA